MDRIEINFDIDKWLDKFVDKHRQQSDEEFRGWMYE